MSATLQLLLLRPPPSHSHPGRLPLVAGLMAATLQLLGTGDLDMAEKALEALQSLLQGGDAAVAAANLREADAGAP